MNDREIAAALSNATETEKAEFAEFLAGALAPLGLDDSDAAKREIVAALDRFALPPDGGGNVEGLI